MQGTSVTSPQLHGFPLALATFAVAIAAFMNVLDTTIAVVALPTISGNLAATPSQGSWVITIYGVCLAVVLPLSGWITRRYGLVHTFCVAVLLFTFTSWTCAAASSFNQLLLFRGLQGLAGGLLLPLSQSLLMRIYPPDRVGVALSVWGLASAVAPVVGPLLGGYLTDVAGWPWIFYVNIPFGIFSAYVCWSLLRPYESETRNEPVDYIGLILLMVGVISGQLLLDRGHELDWLASTEVRVLAVLAVSCLLMFLVWERDEPYPIVDLSLFRHSHFVVGTSLISIFYTSFVVSGVIIPIWTQTVLGYTARWSGIVMSTTSLLPLLLMPILGARLRNYDPRPMVFFGGIIGACAMLLHAYSNTDVSASHIALVRFSTGLCMPFLWMPLMMLCMDGLPPDKVTTASGLFNFMRMAASSFGTALAVTLWDERAIFHHAHLVETAARDLPATTEFMQSLIEVTGSAQSALQALDTIVGRQARTLGLIDVYYVCAAAILFVGIAAAFLARSVAPQPSAALPHE